MTFLQYGLKHRIQPLEHISVGKADNAVALIVRPLGASLVVLDLLGLG
jgi:hypothetical protein